MTAPVVSFYEEDNVTEFENWSLGEVKAGNKSEETTFLIWNNRGDNEKDVSTMQDTQITILDDGSAVTDFIDDQWTWIKDDHKEGDPFVQIGGTTTKELSGKDLQDGQILGTRNSGAIEDDENYAKCTIYVQPDVTTTVSGRREFKLRLTYYYV